MEKNVFENSFRSWRKTNVNTATMLIQTSHALINLREPELLIWAISDR